MNVLLDVIDEKSGLLLNPHADEQVRVDVGLLRDQRDQLLTSIDDAEDFAQYGDSETRADREKQIELLGGLVDLLDTLLDHAAGQFHPASNAPQKTRHPLWEEDSPKEN